MTCSCLHPDATIGCGTHEDGARLYAEARRECPEHGPRCLHDYRLEFRHGEAHEDGWPGLEIELVCDDCGRRWVYALISSHPAMQPEACAQCGRVAGCMSEVTR